MYSSQSIRCFSFRTERENEMRWKNGKKLSHCLCFNKMHAINFHLSVVSVPGLTMSYEWMVNNSIHPMILSLSDATLSKHLPTIGSMHSKRGKRRRGQKWLQTDMNGNGSGNRNRKDRCLANVIVNFAEQQWKIWTSILIRAKSISNFKQT